VEIAPRRGVREPNRTFILSGMAACYVLDADQVPGSHKRDRYGILREPIAALRADEALFITSAKLSSGGIDGHILIRDLRRKLIAQFKRAGVTLIEDFDRGGVWAYKPVWAQAYSRAVGPVKEDEVRSRPVDGDG
jgi:hypothetical protein